MGNATGQKEVFKTFLVGKRYWGILGKRTENGHAFQTMHILNSCQCEDGSLVEIH